MVKCGYNGCDQQLHENDPEKYCIYHLPTEKKGISGDEFNKKIRENFTNVGKYNFRGFIFPAGIDFTKWTKEFAQRADFRDAKFEGRFDEGEFAGCCVVFMGMNFKQDADFQGTQFKGGHACFEKAEFSGRSINFYHAEFIGGNALFSGAKFSGGESEFRFAEFSGDYADFGRAEFSGGNANFIGAKFSGKGAIFSGAEFTGGYAWFERAEFSHGDAWFERVEFSGGDADFRGAKFSGGYANFEEAQFERDIYFTDNLFMGNANFSGVKFADTSKFYFTNPRFILKKSDDTSVIPNRVIFEHIKFIPNMAYFENIKRVSHDIVSRLPDTILIFRYCELSNVYFSNNNMSLFSFYKSPYEKAFFYSNDWEERKEYWLGFPYRRKNIICDELLFERSKILAGEDQKKFKAACKIEDLNSHHEIASLYRRFKVALDATKDYTESGWLYFNEFEMKRRALKEEFEGKKRFASLRERGYYRLYSLYKVFMGYGEKPSWSFVWLILFIGLFSIGNLFNSIKNDTGLYVDYNLAWNIPDAGMLFQDWLFSLQYTISRLLPKTYLPEQWRELSSAGYGIIPFANSLVLILFAVFIGIGLKRHFRRF